MCLICLEFKDLAGETYDLGAAIDMHYASEPCQDAQKLHLDKDSGMTPEELSDFDRAWNEYIDSLTSWKPTPSDGVVQSDPGPQGFRILQPNWTTTPKTPFHDCSPGMTPLWGSKGSMWVICKHCGEEMEEL